MSWNYARKDHCPECDRLVEPYETEEYDDSDPD